MQLKAVELDALLQALVGRQRQQCFCKLLHTTSTCSTCGGQGFTFIALEPEVQKQAQKWLRDSRLSSRPQSDLCSPRWSKCRPRRKSPSWPLACYDWHVLTLPKLILPVILSLMLWAWMAVGGMDGYWLAVRIFRFHSFFLITPFVIFFALLALFIIPLGIAGYIDIAERRHPQATSR